MKYSVEVRTGTDKSDFSTLDRIRRIADRCGRPGIESKKGQTNSRVRATGVARFRWATRSQAKIFQGRIEKEFGSRVTTRRLVRRKSKK
ncbi:hypothetical protein ACU8V1_25870 (plasmid) [Rhizobium leguminosarum]